MVCTLRGTPFLFQGEELGLENAVLQEGEVIDPGLRDGARAPIPWEQESPHGWENGGWMQFPPDAAGKAVAVQQADPSSTLSIYKALLQLRRQEPALRRGDFRWLESPAGTLSFERSEGEDVVRVHLNFRANEAVLAGSGEVLFSTGRDHLDGHDGTLRPYEAMILRPNPAS
jgi:alpha-glucosidase